MSMCYTLWSGTEKQPRWPESDLIPTRNLTTRGVVVNSASTGIFLCNYVNTPESVLIWPVLLLNSGFVFPSLCPLDEFLWWLVTDIRVLCFVL